MASRIQIDGSSVDGLRERCFRCVHRTPHSSYHEQGFELLPPNFKGEFLVLHELDLDSRFLP